VVERRNTIPILSNVLLEAKDGALSLTATDMDLAIVERAAAMVEQAGSTTAPALTLYDIVRKLPDGAQVDLDATGEGGQQLLLRSGRSRFTLATLPTDEFPLMTGGDMPHSFQLSADDLKTLIDRTRFAISTEETRYYLNGIYMHTAETNGVSTLRVVATDGHRLARVEMPTPDGAESIPGVIVPRKTVGEIRKLIEEVSGNVMLSLSETKVKFAFDDAILTSKLIDGTFPDYERVIPTGNDKTMVVDCRSFANAVDRVATISTEKSRAVKMQIAEQSLTLSASSPEHGTAQEEIEVDYSREPIEIGFNSKYLLDIATQIASGRAEFTMADAASPTIVKDVDDPNALYVLMPMRV